MDTIATNTRRVRTDLGLPDDVATLLAGHLALGRVGDPDDFGKVIASLLSDDNAGVNARSIEVAGGYIISLLENAMLDHVFITVSDIDRAIAFYEHALAPLGIVHALDYDGKDGPEGHPDLKGFGRDGRVFFWLKAGDADARAAHVGFVADSQAQVDAAYAAAIAAGATDNKPPAARLYYDPRYYAANVLDPDGYSLEFVFKSWQH